MPPGWFNVTKLPLSKEKMAVYNQPSGAQPQIMPKNILCLYPLINKHFTADPALRVLHLFCGTPFALTIIRSIAHTNKRWRMELYAP